MTKIKKFGNAIERFLHGSKGQRFFNFAYSIGAAVVIWGALFKILHLPGGSTLLCIGMGTEIAMFILTAFDRPPREYNWEEVFPARDTHDPADRPNLSGGNAGAVVINGGISQPVDDQYDGSGDSTYESGDSGQGYRQQVTAQYVPSDGAGLVASAGSLLTEEETDSLRESIARMAAASEQISRIADITTATSEYLEGLSGIAAQMQQLQATTRALNEVSSTLLDSYRQITENSDTINESARGYVGSMEDLNRNIGGLNTIYEIQI